MSKIKTTVKPAILCIITMLLVTSILTMENKKQHKCNYKDCPFKGYTKFAGQHSDCEAGTDCYILDSLHFVYPEKSYDYLDSLLFTPVK